MPTRQVNSIQELFRVQALRQTMTNDPSVRILESNAEIDDEDDDNTILQASQGADLTANDESELTGKRRLQQVSTLADRHRIVQWMIADAEQNGEAKIASRTICNFPDQLRGEQKANLMKASRWWKDRDTITASLSNKRRKRV